MMTTESPQDSPPILVTGHKGMLGRALMARLGDRARGGDLPEVDITDEASVRDLVREVRPASVINCAAYTNVDGAEADPEACGRLNADAVELLGRICREAGVHLITISTDYVFTGEGSAPWPEDAPPEAFGPQCVYGATKLEGERRLEAVGGQWAIARTQWLYGAGGKNFIDTIAGLAAVRPSLRVVDDQVGAPTWVEDLADGLARLAETRATGYYHVVNGGAVSWCGVARRIVERLGLDCAVEACASEEFPRPATRPKNSRLATERFAAVAGGPLRSWEDALDAYLRATGRLT
jgi:dTDP-4-dehydrorhamnose reductase